MKTGKLVPEAEMVLEFLRAEVKASRWSRHFEATGANIDRLVGTPNLSDPTENSERALLLDPVRGYRSKTMLFCGFPDDVKWNEAVLTLDELGCVRYPRCDPWMSVSSDRLIRNGACFRVRLPPDDGSRVEAIMAAVRNGSTFPKLIAVATPNLSDLVLIEGNSRATAYCAEGEPGEVPILIGTSPTMPGWRFW